ncbi:MAG: EamA family transporter [Maricaulaceae bacterium]|jgi:drug/metabolite transporter (DMT)-like permease
MSAGDVAVALILTSAFLHAVFNAILKSSGDRYVRRALMNLFACLAATPIAFIVPLPSAEVWLHLAISVLVISPYQIAQIESYKLGDFSAVYPVARGASVALTAIGAAVLFPEAFPPLKIFAFAVVIMALLAFRAGAGGARGPALAWALATAACVSIYTLNDAGGVRAAGDPLTYVVWFFIVHGFAMPIAAVVRHRARVFVQIRQELRTGVIGAALMIAGYSANLIALRLGAVAEIAALREVSVAFGAMIGAMFLGETLGRRRIAAAIVLAAGLVLLRLA